MKRNTAWIALSVLALLFTTTGTSIAGKVANGVIAGTVTNASTAAPLVGAAVNAIGPKTYNVTTSSTGAYSITAAPGVYNVTASMTDFVSATLPATVLSSQTTTVNFSLAPAAPSLPHENRISAYAGPETCLGCHSATIAVDVFNSVHFQVRGEWPPMDMPGAGSHGMLDRACGLPGTTMMANNYAGTAVSPVDGVTTLDDGCGKCHIAYRPPQFYPSSDAALPDMDCLVCHALVYGAEWDDPENIALYGANTEPHQRSVITLPDGMKSWSQDRSLKTAQSVSGAVTTVACDRCHEHGMSGYKRSTPYVEGKDVHATAGRLCTSCHTVSRHKIARGNFVTDGMANELPEINVDCASTTCHGSTPHSVTANAPDLNRHTVNVRCETCHIHRMDDVDNIHRRAWAPFTLDPVTGQWLTTAPTSAGLQYPGFWDAYTEYVPTNTWPTIRWFNGQASMLAQPYGGYAERASAGGNSMLFSFKPFVSGMLFDAGWLPGPPSDFDLVNDTWPYSMKSFYEQNWAKFLAFGFIDSAYQTPAAYWSARPDMAMMLNSFPMMLQFDRAIFLSEAGTVLGHPAAGPQSAATYPGIAKAINSGLGRMAIDMGYFPLGSDPITVGPSMWSGAFFGMWVPVNMDSQSAFFGEVTSFITMSHSTKSNMSFIGDPCTSCHFTSTEYTSGSGDPDVKYLHFANLGYPNLDGNPLVDPMYDRAVVPNDVTVSALTVPSNVRKLKPIAVTVSVSDLNAAGATGTVTLVGKDPSGTLFNVTATQPFTIPAGSTAAVVVNFGSYTSPNAATTITWTATVEAANDANLANNSRTAKTTVK